MQDFKKLVVWQKAHDLTLDVYRATAPFPATEIYGLTSQMRRSSASIPANIAEGCGRDGNVEFARFVQIAFGSASELEYQLLLAHDLGYLDADRFSTLTTQIVEVKRMLGGLLRKLRQEL